MTLLEELKYRGFIKDFTDEKGLTELLEKEKISFYCGFDPTADSLHVGHMIPILLAKHFQNHGHRPIILVGGGTGLIGDPSGKKNERELLTLEKSLENSKGIHNQLAKFLRFDDKDGATLVNNYDWLKDISMISFLRDYGKNFTINYMLNKDVVASRLDAGISFTEFSYMIVQSIDFLHLYQHNNARLQIGGSEQWGNITAGLDLIRKVVGEQAKAYGLTLNLLTKSDGTKFGKTAGGALWLDAKRTHPYKIYQYFINTADADVIMLLKRYSFIEPKEIDAIEQRFIVDPGTREAQKVLAFEVVKLIHGEEMANKVVSMSQTLFNGDFSKLSAEDIEACLEGVETIKARENMTLLDAVVEAKLASSRREGREFIKNNAVAVNGNKIVDENMILDASVAIDNKYIVLKRGKKLYALVAF